MGLQPQPGCSEARGCLQGHLSDRHPQSPDRDSPVTCSRKFTPCRTTQRFHSTACRRAARITRRGFQRHMVLSVRDMERFHAMLEDRSEKRCAGCGGAMSWTRSTRRYCSAKCRLRAHRERGKSITRARIEQALAKALDKAHREARSKRVIAALRRGEDPSPP
jgi:hypothetical protein